MHACRMKTFQPAEKTEDTAPENELEMFIRISLIKNSEEEEDDDPRVVDELPKPKTNGSG